MVGDVLGAEVVFFEQHDSGGGLRQPVLAVGRIVVVAGNGPDSVLVLDPERDGLGGGLVELDHLE